MATYIATIYLQTIDLIDGIGYFSLTDENGQSRPTTNARPFLGDFGLFSRQGYPKSSYFAFMLLHRLDSSVVQKGDNYIVTRSASGFHVMVINMSDYEKHPDKQSLEHIPYEQRYQVFRETPAVSFRGIIHVIKGSYRITKHTMNRRHGSPYDAWVYMGSPVHTSEEIERAIYCLSHPLLHCREELDTDTILLEEQIEPHGIVLFEVEHLI